jgi:hypothetical protein
VQGNHLTVTPVTEQFGRLRQQQKGLEKQLDALKAKQASESVGSMPALHRFVDALEAQEGEEKE